MNLSQIKSWLDTPRPLSDAEQDDLRNELNRYPYFAPLKILTQLTSEIGPPEGAPVPDVNPVIAALLRKSLASARQEREHAAAATPADDENLIAPFSASDYFMQQGINAKPEGHANSAASPANINPPEDPKTLMVMMSFADWLRHFKQKSEKEQEEDAEKRALKSHWQREKLAAALEEEEDEIPDGVFRMAVDSISREDNPASESLAEILVKQGKSGAAIDMYRRLQLRNPAKSGYFAARIEALQRGAD